MLINSLPAGGAVGAGASTKAVHKRSQTLLYQTLYARLNDNDIHHFLKTVGFLQKYSDIKTPAPGFDFETCSAHVYSTKSKPFGKSISGGPLIAHVHLGDVYLTSAFTSAIRL